MTFMQWSLVTNAARLAAQAHAGQLRHDGTPYMQHPARVAVLLARAGGDDELVAAGFLHDVIEDCDVDWDDIEATCSENVANWVAAMTKDMRQPEAPREAAYKQQLMDGPWQGRAVKLADQIDNYTNASNQARTKVRPKAQWALEIASEDQGEVSVSLRAQLHGIVSEPVQAGAVDH